MKRVNILLISQPNTAGMKRRVIDVPSRIAPNEDQSPACSPAIAPAYPVISR